MKRAQFQKSLGSCPESDASLFPLSLLVKSNQHFAGLELKRKLLAGVIRRLHQLRIAPARDEIVVGTRDLHQDRVNECNGDFTSTIRNGGLAYDG